MPSFVECSFSKPAGMVSIVKNLSFVETVLYFTTFDGNMGIPFACLLFASLLLSLDEATNKEETALVL